MITTFMNQKKRTHSGAAKEHGVADNAGSADASVLSKPTFSTGIVKLMAPFLTASDLCSLEATCRAATTQQWCADQEVWKALALQTWSVLATTSAQDDDNNDDDDDGKTATLLDTTMARLGATSFKSLFCEPRLWLEISAAQVRLLPGWRDAMHPFRTECGNCGCNCQDGECGGIPIEGKWRWDKNEKFVSCVQRSLLNFCGLP